MSVQVGGTVGVIRDKGGAVHNVRAYGAKGDGATDDVAAIHAARDAAGEGGVVFFPRPATSYLAASTLSPLVGQAWISDTGLQYPYSSAVETKIKGNFNGTLIDLTNVPGVSLRGLTLEGSNNAAHTNAIGVKGTTSFACEIDRCAIIFFGSSAIKWVSGNALRITNTYTSNCVLSYAGLAAYLGAVDIDATDHYLHNNELGANGNYGSGWSAALVLRAGGCFLSNNVMELSEVGCVVTSAAICNVFVNNRVDHAQTDGWVVSGSNHVLIGNKGHQCGLHATNTYDAFRLDTGSTNCLLMANSVLTVGGGNVPKYAFRDVVNHSIGSGNVFRHNIAPASSYGTNRYSVANAYTVVEDPYYAQAVVNGDVNINYSPPVSPRTQIFNSPLSTNRTVTLGVTNSTNGIRGRIVRTAAATGASTLSVTISGGATLTTLAAGEWCEVEQTESTHNWMLVARGTGV